MNEAPLCIVIPALDAEAVIASTLRSVFAGRESGLVGEVLVVDGGSSDKTMKIGREAGARVISAPRGRGGQLRAGAGNADRPWLLFLHADTVLSPAWTEAAKIHIGGAEDRAGAFRLRFSSRDARARLVAMGANLRTQAFALPYGDQGLLISKVLYDEVGGYPDQPLFEDVALVRRIIKAKGRGAIRLLSAEATTSAEKYEQDGYGRRVLKNLQLLSKYLLGADPTALARRYR